MGSKVPTESGGLDSKLPTDSGRFQRSPRSKEKEKFCSKVPTDPGKLGPEVPPDSGRLDFCRFRETGFQSPADLGRLVPKFPQFQGDWVQSSFRFRGTGFQSSHNLKDTRFQSFLLFRDTGFPNSIGTHPQFECERFHLHQELWIVLDNLCIFYLNDRTTTPFHSTHCKDEPVSKFLDPPLHAPTYNKKKKCEVWQ